MTYKDILNDQEILSIYNKIDNNNNQIIHGKQHVLNVIENLDKLNNVLNINKKDLELLKIATTLHDIGHIYNKDIHPFKGSEYAKEYLKNKLDINDINKIVLAIKNHHEKDSINDISLFDHLLLFADKMDFTYKRLNPNHKTKEYLLESDILDINFKLDENNFNVIIKTNKIDIEKFKYWSYYPKITKRIEEFAHKINKKSNIKITF